MPEVEFVAATYSSGLCHHRVRFSALGPFRWTYCGRQVKSGWRNLTDREVRFFERECIGCVVRLEGGAWRNQHRVG